MPEKDNALEVGGRTHMATERPEGGNKKILGHYSEIMWLLLLKRFFGTTWAIPWHFFGTTRPPLVVLLVTVGVAFLLLSFFSILLIVLRRPILS